MKNKPQLTPQQLADKYDLYSPLLYRLCVLKLGNRHDAEDALQNTFIKYYYKAPVFSGGEEEKAWLIRVAINCCKDFQKSFWQRNIVSLNEAAEISTGAIEDAVRLIDVFELSPKNRIVIELYYYEGYTISEIAKMLKISEKSVSSRLSRARKKLKIEMEASENEKMELSRSIESIKQDRELKDHILKAVEEKDKVTVIKRPLFVPVLAGIMLCLNIGIVAKLIITNNSQVNMSELKARTTLSSVENDETQSSEQSIISEDKALMDLNHSMNKAENEQLEQEYQNRIEEFQEKCDNGELVRVNTWYAPTYYNPEQELPCYLDTEVLKNMDRNPFAIGVTSDEDWDFTYCRYVERIDIVVEDSRTDTGLTNIVYGSWTNHEYIVGYNGDTLPENICSITESDVVIPEEINISDLDKVINKFSSDEDINQTYQETGDEMLKHYESLGYTDHYYGPKDFYLMFKNSHNTNDPNDNNLEVVEQYYASALNENTGDTDSIGDAVLLDIFLINEDGFDVTEVLRDSTEEYWKETIWNTERMEPVPKATVPDIIGMDLSDAKKALETAGFSVSVTYNPISDTSFSFNQVMGIYEYEPGDVVYEGKSVTLNVAGSVVPNVFGHPIASAKELIENAGFVPKIEYMDEAAKSSSDVFVWNCSPNFGTALTQGDTVTIYVTSPEFGCYSEIIGKALSTRRQKLYSLEETKKIIAENQPSEETQILLSDYHYDCYGPDGVTTAWGKFYGDYFVVDAFETISDRSNSIPYLQCGMMYEKDIEELLDNTFYKEHTLDITDTGYQDYDYQIHYKQNDDTDIYAYIRVGEKREDDIKYKQIKKICVSSKALSKWDNFEIVTQD